MSFIQGAMRNALSIQADPSRAMGNAQRAFASSGNLALKLTALIDQEEQNKVQNLQRQQQLDETGRANLANEDYRDRALDINDENADNSLALGYSQLNESMRRTDIMDTNADATRKLNQKDHRLKALQLKLTTNTPAASVPLIDKMGNPTEAGLNFTNTKKEISNYIDSAYLNNGVKTPSGSTVEVKPGSKTLSTTPNSYVDATTGKTLERNVPTTETIEPGTETVNTGVKQPDGSVAVRSQEVPVFKKKTVVDKYPDLVSDNAGGYKERTTSKEEKAYVDIMKDMSQGKTDSLPNIFNYAGKVGNVDNAVDTVKTLMIEKPEAMLRNYGEKLNQNPIIKQSLVDSLVTKLSGAPMFKDGKPIMNNGVPVTSGIESSEGSNRLVQLARDGVVTSDEINNALQRMQPGSAKTAVQGVARSLKVMEDARKNANNEKHQVAARSKIEEEITGMLTGGSADKFLTLAAGTNIIGWLTGYGSEGASYIGDAIPAVTDSVAKGDQDYRIRYGDTKFLESFQDVNRIAKDGWGEGRSLDYKKLIDSANAMKGQFKGFEINEKNLLTLQYLDTYMTNKGNHERYTEQVASEHPRPDRGFELASKQFTEAGSALKEMGVDPEKTSYAKLAASMYKGDSLDDFMATMSTKRYADMNAAEKNIYALVTYMNTKNNLGTFNPQSRIMAATGDAAHAIGEGFDWVVDKFKGKKD